MICLMGLAITSCDKDNTDTETTETGTTPAGYVDLGLPSGTKWKATNEGGYYNYYSAVEIFGSKLPTREQFVELMSLCTFSWDPNKKGANFVSTVNGNSIFFPAAGCRDWIGDLDDDEYDDLVGSYGYYWSSTLNGSDEACFFVFGSEGQQMSNNDREWRYSVRLVYNP